MDETFLDDLTVVEYGDLPDIQEHLSVMGIPVGGQGLSITGGVVSRVEVPCWSHSNR